MDESKNKHARNEKIAEEILLENVKAEPIAGKIVIYAIISALIKTKKLGILRIADKCYDILSKYKEKNKDKKFNITDDSFFSFMQQFSEWWGLIKVTGNRMRTPNSRRIVSLNVSEKIVEKIMKILKKEIQI